MKRSRKPVRASSYRLRRSHITAASDSTSGSYVIIGWQGDKDEEVVGSNNPTSLQSIFNEAEKIGKSGKYSDIEIHISFKQDVESSAYASKRPIRAARQEVINYLEFNEMSEEQKQQAVQKFFDSGYAYEWFNEDQMFWYDDNVKEMADETERESGLSIHTDKIYWQSNSQGPYPEWDLSRVFDTYDGPEFTIEFWGKSTDVKYAVTVDDEDIDDGNIPAEAQEIVDRAQEFITGVWKYIEEICSGYPDETWAYETLEANNYEFRVDDNGNVVKMA